MIKHVNKNCLYSGHVLHFPDGVDVEGISPGIRGRSEFVITVVETDGNFEREIPTIDGFSRVASPCRITGHYRGKESQPVYLYCNDVGPLAGIDRAPERQPVTVGEPMEKVESFEQAKQILESVGLILEKKKTVSDFVTYLKENGFTASMDGGEKFYCVRKLNHDNFDFSQYPNFLKQITDEGLYDRSFVSVIADKDELDKKFTVASLPIFGRTDKYETKWLRCYSPEDTVEQDFRDRKYGPKKRLDFFQVPDDEKVSLPDMKAAIENAGLPLSEFFSRKYGQGIKTTVGFSKEECDGWNSIPADKDTRYIYEAGDKFLMISGAFESLSKKRFSSVEKVIQYLKSEIAAKEAEA